VKSTTTTRNYQVTHQNKLPFGVIGKIYSGTVNHMSIRGIVALLLTPAHRELFGVN